jgi:hypothetical protein
MKSATANESAGAIDQQASPRQHPTNIGDSHLFLKQVTVTNYPVPNEWNNTADCA